jgi:hypothetical protein
MTDKIYSIGRVYKLISDNGLAYIGSTTRTLSQRLSSHKQNYKKNGVITSKQLFENCATVIIELIEEVANITLKDLRIVEGKHIRVSDCVNRMIAGRTPKEYYEDFKDNIKKYQNDYYVKNKDILTTRQKKYNEQNKEKIKVCRKEYRKVNKDTLKTKQKEIILCDRCKCETSRSNKSQHQKTQKCINITISGNSNIINLNK